MIYIDCSTAAVKTYTQKVKKKIARKSKLGEEIVETRKKILNFKRRRFMISNGDDDEQNTREKKGSKTVAIGEGRNAEGLGEIRG